MSGKRRRYSLQFREQAARLVIETSPPVAHVAAEIGVGEQLLGSWVHLQRQSAAAGDTAAVLDVDEPPSWSSRAARMSNYVWTVRFSKIRGGPGTARSRSRPCSLKQRKPPDAPPPLPKVRISKPVCSRSLHRFSDRTKIGICEGVGRIQPPSGRAAKRACLTPLDGRLIDQISHGLDELEPKQREHLQQAVTVVRRHRSVMLGMPRTRQTLPDLRPERAP
jgi:Transposase